MVKNKKALEIGRNILCVICIVGIALTYYGYSINQMPIAVCGLGVSTISGTYIYFVISHIKKKEKETKNENEQQSLYEITSKTAKVEVELSENSQQKNELYEKLNFRLNLYILETYHFQDMFYH